MDFFFNKGPESFLPGDAFTPCHVFTTFRSIYSLNDALGTTLKSSNALPTSTTLANLITLAPGIYQVSYEFSWIPSGAKSYGTLLSVQTGIGYGYVAYTDTDGKQYIRHHNVSAWQTDWIGTNPTILDFSVSPANTGAFQINSSSNNLINYNNFINCYVIGTNNLFVKVYTYNNILYGNIVDASGTLKTSGTYTLRCLYFH